MADEQIRDAHEAAAVRWLLRAAAPASAPGPSWWSRFVGRLARVTMRRAAAG